jgi:hypothetical protein
MTEKAKFIGEKPVNSSSATSHDFYVGITYRQWLIGQALASCPDARTNKGAAQCAIEVADCILEKLAEEE